jgi:hypothetical protein
MSLVRAHNHVESNGDAGLFVWPHALAATVWSDYRLPATPDDMRPIEEIALAELRAAVRDSQAEDMPVEVARRFGLRRLSNTARQRIQAAMGAACVAADAAKGGGAQE